MNWGFPTFLGRALTVFVSTDASLNILLPMKDAKSESILTDTQN